MDNLFATVSTWVTRRVIVFFAQQTQQSSHSLAKMRVTVAIVLLLVFFVCFSQADEHTLFLSKLKKAVSKAKSAITKTTSKVVRSVNKAKDVVNKAKDLAGKAKNIVNKAKDFAGKAKKAVAGLKDKLMSFAKYGNHCGKGHGKAGVPVIDAIDLGCYHHDRCYEAFGFGNCGCDRDAIVEIKKALKTNVSWKAKAAGRVGLIWLSKHGCDYVSKTADGTCTKGKNKNLKGSDTKLWYSCSAKTFTAPTAPNAASVIAKFYGRKAPISKAAPATEGGKIDKEVKSDNKKIKKLESLLGDKKKKSGKKSAGKKTAGKKVTRKSGKAGKKASKKSSGKKATRKSGKAGKKSAGKKSSGKKAGRKGGKKSSGKKSVKSLESLVNKQLKKVNKVSSGKKAGRKSRKGRKAGKRRGCGAGLEVSFSGKTSVSIGNVKL